jgi:hypothetical protein
MQAALELDWVAEHHVNIIEFDTSLSDRLLD